MKVVFLDEVHEILAERLLSANHEVVMAMDCSLEECIQIVKDADGIVIRSRFAMNADFLNNCTKLKFIARSGAGMENIDEVYCSTRNISLFNAPEGNRNAVGEHCLGMLLSLMNHFRRGDAEVRVGQWNREKNRGEELDGKTIGIIGYGNNGAAFAKKLRGFDVRILAFDKYKTGFSDESVFESTLEQIYEEADVLSFHIPQNKETVAFGNADFFNAFKKPIYLLNLSRGKIVDTNALMNAIDSGNVKAAGLDVLEYEKSSFESFMSEKMPDTLSRLLAADNVLLSPHVGGWTNESYFKLSAVLADKILGKFPN